MTDLNIYKKLFDNRDEGILIFDKKLNIIYHNKNFNKILIYSENTLFDTLDNIFSEKNISKIKNKSTLFKNYQSNKYSIIIIDFIIYDVL